jgi:type IV secretory pathway protease TraF
MRVMKTRRGKAITLLLVAVAVAMLAVPVSAGGARLVWNFTPSAPVGLYSIEREAWRKGDRVAVRPAPALADLLDQMGILKRGRLLIKTVAAADGDQVCRVGTTLTINGHASAIARSVTSIGKKLPAWEGCQMLSADEVLLLGETEESFDGRYFGVTGAAEVVGPVRLLASVDGAGGPPADGWQE